MPAVSPYLNPHRTEAVWDVSGAFVADRELVAFHQFCRETLGLEPFHIVHGAPLCLWNSGRVLAHMMREAEDVRQAGLAYEQLGVSVYLTFTNLLLGPQELKDPTGHALCRFFTRHNPTGRNAAIIANHGLRELLRREYPDLRLISSVLHITNNEPERSPDVYRRLADEYDEVMVHPDDVRRPELLEKLEHKDKYILLVNEYCIRNCPIRSFHYRSLSEQALNFLSYDDSRFAQAQANNGCGNLHTLLIDEKVSAASLLTAAKKASALIKEAEVFDVYEGKGLPEGKKSVALCFFLYDETKTLREEEAAEANTHKALAKIEYANVELDSTAGTLRFDVNVSAVAGFTANLLPFVTEGTVSKLKGSNGETEFHWVALAAVEGSYGKEVSFMGDSMMTFSYEVDMSQTLVEEYADLEIVCFIQNRETREIYQSSAHDIVKTPMNLEKPAEPVDPSANEEDAMPSVKLYPNPAVDNAYVSGLEKAAVQVFDLTGRLVYEVRDVDNVLELPVRDLEAGTYVVRIAQDGKTAVRKLNVLK